MNSSKTERFFDRFGSLLEVANWLDQTSLDSLAERVVELAPKSILEIGGGRGGLADRILTHLDSHLTEYLLTDISETNLKSAQNRLKDYISLRLQKSSGEVAELHRSGRFDCVVSSYVLDTFPYVQRTAYYTAIFEVLEPQGTFLSLTTCAGNTALSKWVMKGWKFLYSIEPMLVGGSNVINLPDELDQSHWAPINSWTVCSRHFASQLVIAKKI